MSLKPNELIITGRLANSSLWTPFKSDLGEKKEAWKADILIDPHTEEGKATLKAIEAQIKAICLEQWKKYPLTWPDPKRLCLRDGNMKVGKDDEIKDGYEGMKYLTVSRNTVSKKGNLMTPPGVFDRSKNPLPKGSTVPYNGCKVKVHADFYGTEAGGKGVFAGLISVMHWAEGDPIQGGGGGAPSADAYGETAEEGEEV